MNEPVIETDSAVIMEYLAMEFAKRVNAHHIATFLRVSGCSCGAISLTVDLSQTPQSKPFVIRLARQFAKKNNLHFGTELDVCSACKAPKGSRTSHEMWFGANGLEKSEVKVYGPIIDAAPVRKVDLPAPSIQAPQGGT